MANEPENHVVAPLRYLANTANLAVYMASVGGGEVPEHQGNFVEVATRIDNGRRRAPAFTLDREGFELTPHATAVVDFYDDRQIAEVYEPEVRRLVSRITGADRVEIFDHTRRSSSAEVRKRRQIREAAATVHNDYTDRSGPRRLRDHFADDPRTLASLSDRRFAIVNVWRSMRGVVQQAPLALCDASTVPPADLVAVTRQARDRIGELQLVLHNPAHRWYYFPDMRPDEALLIKTYDSATDGPARFTIHTSFQDPTVENAPPRESIETRCFVFF